MVILKMSVVMLSGAGPGNVQYYVTTMQGYKHCSIIHTDILQILQYYYCPACLRKQEYRTKQVTKLMHCTTTPQFLLLLTTTRVLQAIAGLMLE
jgi:hypothetical protein